MNNLIPDTFPCVVMGNESLLIQCSEILLQRGHNIRAVVSRNQDIIGWAVAKGLKVITPSPDLANSLQHETFDWLFSIANLDIIPQAVLDQARRGAVNFHDGPLPAYAGLNVPVWALINRERSHAITWHLIDSGVDTGDIVEQRRFDISPSDTAFTLNTKCFSAAIDSFAPMLDKLAVGRFEKQDPGLRHYFGKNDRPAAVLDFSKPADDLVALVRGLDHNGYWNPLTCPKIIIKDQVLLVGAAETAPIASTSATPGKVEQVGKDTLTVITGFGAIVLQDITDQSGTKTDVLSLVQAGEILQSDSPESLRQQTAELIKTEGYWRKKLQAYQPALLPMATKSVAAADMKSLPLAPHENLAGIVGLWAAKYAENGVCDLALQVAGDITPAFHADWVPLRFDGQNGPCGAALAGFEKELSAAQANRSFARDIEARDSVIDLSQTPDIGVASGQGASPIRGVCVTITLDETGAGELHYDATRLDGATAARLVAQINHLAQELPLDLPLAEVSVLPQAERALVLTEWNDTAQPYDKTCIHQLFEQQVAKTPDAEALVFEAQSLSYAELNARANQVAHVLRELGVAPGVTVALFTDRSPDLLVGALAIQKAGGAYVPVDPAYPADRIAHVVSDSQAAVILCQAAIAAQLPEHSAQLLAIDTDPRIGTAPETNPDSGVTPDDLAYLIYTSGSTGLPKGVMVEHANVANFFAGMDRKIDSATGGVWLAVTSLSFDISVLELFYTLARGFKVVLASTESRVMASGDGVTISNRKIDFSLFFWGNDDGVGRDKYKLLLDGAKYADQNGFCAVWTPERHFHAFGGPYPNPSVTGAAVAAVTQNLAVRSGSCVAPLHHTARIAEDWAVIDNLTNGRAGLGIASGWQPDDFVLRPENTPPNNKPAMFKAIEDLRALWRGEAVDFPTKDGTPFAVTTLPRPVSRELPIWVTIAGNPDTWREAGEIGANVLTHLLGQSIDVVADRIKIYHDALRKAGHNPDDFTVTLMLHSFVGADREKVRETARGPMKSYLGAAAGLIRQCAWEFPAFKRPEGVNNAFEIDLATLGADEIDSILDFAFERYFETSGLFGTVEDCLQRVEQIKAIGIDEIACLIDYGIAVPDVLDSLVPLAEVLQKANTPSDVATDDFSIAAQIQRHKVTHLQATPSMVQMLVDDSATHGALGQVKHLLIGGEALPGTLVKTLGHITTASVLNMYGPTETTIWSSCEAAQAGDGVVNIGGPIANTRLYVLDQALQPLPIGTPGELYIGGAGVTRGYWQQPALTSERFLPDPFVENQRMYRTGDLVAWRADGKLDFLGRVDNQIKLRGHRIELGEIESLLATAPHVKQAVVIAREISAGDTRLVAYIVAEQPIAESDLRQRLGKSLPAYMVPSHFVMLDNLPLTPNRKIDRKALPAPAPAAQSTPISKSKPATQNPVEEKIAEIWAGILGVSNINPDDNFFELGGHSLLAVQAHREIKAALGVGKLSITDIFRFPVLSALAARLGGDAAGAPEKPQVEMAAQVQQRTDAMSKRRAMRARRGNLR